MHCERCARPLADVAADVDGWADLYGGVVDGVFVDEAPSAFDGAGVADYVGALLARARGRGLGAVLNPGTRVDAAGARVCSSADAVVAFEAAHATFYDTWGRYAVTRGGGDGDAAAAAAAGAAAADGASSSGGSGSGGNDGGVCSLRRGAAAPAAIVHSLPAAAAGAKPAAARETLAALLADARARGYRWVYATDRVAPDCYSGLPTCWGDLIDLLLLEGGEGGGGGGGGGGDGLAAAAAGGGKAPSAVCANGAAAAATSG